MKNMKSSLSILPTRSVTPMQVGRVHFRDSCLAIVLSELLIQATMALLYCTVLYCTLTYCTVLYCTVPYCTVLDFIVLYCIVLYCTVLYCIVQCCTVLYCSVLYCIVLYFVVLYCTVLYCTVLYCTVLYCTVLSCTVLYIVLYCTEVVVDEVSAGLGADVPPVVREVEVDEEHEVLAVHPHDSVRYSDAGWTSPLS
jgi:hypothetical protein